MDQNRLEDIAIYFLLTQLLLLVKTSVYGSQKLGFVLNYANQTKAQA